MATVLLVEDEESLRETLCRYLTHVGHVVVPAASGSEALEAGIGSNPDVLIADWMLKNHIHGLHVSQIFRALHPALQTILITGFPSADLIEDSERSGVMRVLEKPFDLQELRRAVDDAVSLPAELIPIASSPIGTPGQRALGPSTHEAVPVAALAVTFEGRIEFSSAGAQELFEASALTGACSTLFELFGPDALLKIVEAEGDWISIGPVGRPTSAWWLRSRPRVSSGGWIVVLVPSDQEQRRSDPRIRILLDDRRTGEANWIDEPGPVIVIEQDSLVRRLMVSQIERSGVLCYASENFQNAIRLLLAEPRVRTVFVDCALAGPELYSWAAQIRAVRPDVKIVGTGVIGEEKALLEQGVARVLRKPWRIQDLLDTIDS